MVQGGIGYDEFDRAFPHSKWEQIEGFSTKPGIEYYLWVERGSELDPRAVSTSAWIESDNMLYWKVEHDGPLSTIREGFDRFRAAMEYVPPPAPKPYANHPLYGRF